MKRIKRGSFVLEVAYSVWNKEIPNRVSLCTVVQRFIMLIVPFLVLFALVYGFMVPGMFVWGFLIAKRPPFKSEPGTDLIHYKHWPKISGHRVYPIVIILLPIGLLCIYRAVLSMWKELDEGLPYLMNHTTLWVVVGIIAAALIIVGIWRFFQSETGQLFSDWIRAQKEKVCPILQVVDE